MNLSSVAAVTAAILFCRPSMPPKTAASYASLVVARAAKAKVDPLLFVAIVKHESGWVEAARSKDGEDHGLGQVRARYLPACAKDKDPVHSPSTGCAAEKVRLLDGAYNIGVAFDAIETWKKLCKAKTGSEREESWLSSYAGLNRPKAGVMCGSKATAGGGWTPLAKTPAVVRQFLAIRRALRLRLEALPPGPP
jgi:hypothetical protein